MNAERNVATVRTFLHMLELMDIDAWALLWAEDADHHYPFGTEMFPRHIKGRTEIHRAWQETPEVFLRMSFALRETWVDGDTVIARFDGECVRRGHGPALREQLPGDLPVRPGRPDQGLLGVLRPDRGGGGVRARRRALPQGTPDVRLDDVRRLSVAIDTS